MQIQLIDVVSPLVGFITGGIVGLSFGMLQKAAQRRHEKLARAGRFCDGWNAMPGSLRRVAGLLVVLALVQVFCPLLFTQARQWWVSGGVVAGYAIILYRQLRQRLAHQP
jgi:hypothetical protein